MDSLYQAVALAFQHRSHYTLAELAYITAALFLRCLVTYSQLVNSSSTKFGTPLQYFNPQFLSPYGWIVGCVEYLHLLLVPKVGYWFDRKYNICTYILASFR
jgi:hypothetical protein